VVQVISSQSSGRGSFESGVRIRHIVVSGNPSMSMIQDFIAELFHPDHAEDADDLHAIFLFPRGTVDMQEIMDFVRQKEYIHIAAKVHCFTGSLLVGQDLQRVSALQASAFFILPNTQCESPTQEDTENIIRLMSLKRYVPEARAILLLMHSESQHILQTSGGGQDSELTKNVSCIAVDQFKLELVGKACEVVGFSTFISNLCKSIDDDDDDEDESKPIWQQDYERGVGNELYEIELSKLYSDREAIFCEVVVDVLEQTGGIVYLVGLVEIALDGKKKVLINPGPRYKVKPPASGTTTSGIFIAADREAVVQCEGGMVFLGRRERPRGTNEALAASTDAVALQTKSKPNLAHVDPRLLNYMSAKQGRTARQLVTLVKQHQRSMQPARPPMKLLACGGHILFLCVGESAHDEIRVGIEHFVRPLRRRQPGPGEKSVPIVVLAPQKPRDWENVCDQDEVYFMKGSPLSHFDIERCNFHNASTIFICNVGSNGHKPAMPWMVDSEVICCVRLLESRLEPGAATVVIADLSIDTNHPFLPVPTTSNLGAGPPMHRSLSTLSSMSFNMVRKMSMRPTGPDDRLEYEKLLKKVPDYYYQPRFASGQLFVGACVTSLAVNTYYNPSLYQLVRAMIASNVIMIKVPASWVGKSYFEFFDHLLWSQGLLSIAIFRRADPNQQPRYQGDDSDKKQFAFLYTAPPAKETTMLKTDRVMCFAAMGYSTKKG